jgi:hypothetical protein
MISVTTTNRQTIPPGAQPQTVKPPKPKPIRDPSYQISQRSLLIASTACTILSIIPATRFAGSLAMRSVAFMSTSLSMNATWDEGDVKVNAAKVAQTAGVVIGVIALVTAIPALLGTSIAIDLGVQVFEAGRAATKGDGAQATLHLGMAIIDTLALAGVVTGSWQLMVAASSINITLMLTAGIITLCKATDSSGNIKGAQVLDGLCYFAMAGTGIATAITTSKITNYASEKYHYKGTNDTDKTMTFYGGNGSRQYVIAVVKPGERYDFTTNSYMKSVDGNKYLTVLFSDKTVGAMQPTSTTPGHNYTSQKPLDPKLFATLPVGGPTFNISAEEDRT